MSDSPSFVEGLRKQLLTMSHEGSLSANVVAAYLYGGNVTSLELGTALVSNEVDLLVVVDGELSPGAPPMEPAVFQSLVAPLVLCEQHLTPIANGVAPVGYDGSYILIDLVGDCTEGIRTARADSVVAAQKPKLLVFGHDVYASLCGVSFTPAMRRELSSTMDRYLRREFFGRGDAYARRSISKNAIFLASLVDPVLIRTNDKTLIVEHLARSHPDLGSLLAFFLRVTHDPPSVSSCEVEEAYDFFYRWYSDRYLVGTDHE